MTNSRTALLVLTALAGLGMLAAPAPASATNWSWLANKPYVDCLKLMNSMAAGGGIWGAAQNSGQQAANSERGRHMCNMKYYGHP